MARTKTKKNDAKWVPGPECQAAWNRILESAHVCAASLFGEKAAEDPDDASIRIKVLATGMLYFLVRLDPNDARDLYFGENGLATLNHKPYPRNHKPREAPFADLLPPDWMIEMMMGRPAPKAAGRASKA